VCSIIVVAFLVSDVVVALLVSSVVVALLVISVAVALLVSGRVVALLVCSVAVAFLVSCLVVLVPVSDVVVEVPMNGVVVKTVTYVVITKGSYILSLKSFIFSLSTECTYFLWLLCINHVMYNSYIPQFTRYVFQQWYSMKVLRLRCSMYREDQAATVQAQVRSERRCTDYQSPRQRECKYG